MGEGVSRIEPKMTGEVRLTRPPDQPGSLNIYVSTMDTDQGVRIIADFGRAIWWAGFTADEAEKFAQDLLGAARTARTLFVPQGGNDDGED